MIDKHIEVDYTDPDHRYFLGQRTYRSATQIIERFYEHFDTEGTAEMMAYKYGQTPEYWKEKWRKHNKKSLERGSLLHNEKEDFLHNRGYDSINGKIFKVHNLELPRLRNEWSQPGGYYNLPDGIYPEMKMWHHGWGIAGRVDKPIIETIDNIRYMHVDDYKTNAAIRMESFCDRDGNYRMMLGPLSHLMDCEYYHYSLQLSLYQYIGEYFGFTPGKRRIIHYPHPIPGLGTPKPKIYDNLPYLRQEVEAMLYQLKEERWLMTAA